jgi:hypothetical protein
MQQVLSPIKISSMQLQGNGLSGQRSTSGGFDEYFPVIETLLDHLERCGKGDCLVGVDDGQELRNFKLFDGLNPFTRKLLKVHIRLGWYKLEEYYNKLNSLAYIAAVIFHPCSKFKLLEDLWQAVPLKKANRWKLNYLTRLRTRWVQDYRNK